jgi:hypothetical protein
MLRHLKAASLALCLAAAVITPASAERLHYDPDTALRSGWIAQLDYKVESCYFATAQMLLGHYRTLERDDALALMTETSPGSICHTEAALYSGNLIGMSPGDAAEHELGLANMALTLALNLGMPQ